MKILFSKTVFLALIIFIPVSHSQTIFHPDRFGAGYNYTNSSCNAFNSDTHTFYFSEGAADFYFCFSNMQYSKITQKSYGIGLNFYQIIECNKMYPSISLLALMMDSGVGFEIGTSFSIEAYGNDEVHVIPEIGGGIALLKNEKTNDIISGRSGAFHTGLNLGFYSDKHFILTATPGYVITSPNSYFTISIGLIFSSTKKNNSDSNAK